MRYDPVTHSLKTWQDSFLTDFQPSLVTLPRWGMMRSGVLFRQKTPELTTRESESGFWPTPSANGNTCGTSDATLQSVLDGKCFMTLNRAVRFSQVTLGTPTAMFKVRGEKMRRGRTPNHAEYATLPTTDRGKGNLGEVVGGKLNPMWVAWLMGVPGEWINLDSSVTAWFRNKPRSRSKSLAKG